MGINMELDPLQLNQLPLFRKRLSTRSGSLSVGICVKGALMRSGSGVGGKRPSTNRCYSSSHGCPMGKYRSIYLSLCTVMWRLLAAAWPQKTVSSCTVCVLVLLLEQLGIEGCNR